MRVSSYGEVFDENGEMVDLQPQEHARIVIGENAIFIPHSTHLKYPFRPSNIQAAEEKVKVDNTILFQHPFFKTIFISAKYRIFNGDIWKWEIPTDIPFEILTAFLKKDIMIEVKEGYIYQVATNLINGVEYKRGSEFSDYPKTCDIKFYHPYYKNLYCNWLGYAFKETIEKTFSINISTYVKFYEEGHWHYYKHENFAYECYYQTIIPKNKVVRLIDRKSKFKYIKENLELIDYVDETESLLRHPKYKHYGYLTDKDAIYSVNAGKIITANNLVVIYNSYTRNKIYYNKERFIYECLHQKLLKDNEFLINGEVYNNTVDSFIYKDMVFNNTSNPDFYMTEDGIVYYIPYERIMKVVDGFINIGTKSKPKLLPIPE